MGRDMEVRDSDKGGKPDIYVLSNFCHYFMISMPAVSCINILKYKNMIYRSSPTMQYI